MTRTAKLGNWMLALVLVSTMLFPSGVFAADTTAVSLKFDDNNTLTLSLEDDGQELNVYTVDGSGNTTDVSDKATWSTSSAAVATVKSGQVTPVSVGTTTITAKYGDLAATKKVTVTSPYTALALSPAAGTNVTIGEPVEFTATATKQDGSTVDVTDSVTWSTYDIKVAKVVEGKVTGISQGTTSLTAKYAGLVATTDLYVRSSFQGLMLTPEDDQIMFIGQQPKQIVAEVGDASRVPTNVTSKVTWTSSNPLNATVENGVLTPWVEGTSTIKAQYEDFTKTFKVTVYKTMTKVQANVDSIDLVTGGSAALPKVTGTAVDGTTKDLSKLVDWTIDSSIASVTTTKLEAEGEGDTNLVGKIGDMTVTVPVSVKAKALTLTPSASSLSIVVGSTANLPKVEAVTADGNTIDVTDEVEWTLSSDKALLQEGKIKALVKGSTSLKGTYLNKNVRVSIKMESKINSITATPAIIDLNVNKSKSIMVKGVYADGKKATLSSKMNWVSSNPAVATVKGASVKAVGVGSATLTGSYQGLTATVKVNVTSKLKKLTLSEKSLKMTTGDAKTVTLTAEYDTGEIVDVTKGAIWTTSKVTVATVKEGNITAVAKGSSSIKADFGGKHVSISVSVKDVAAAK
ncbi:Ig-like domain-containing protein [Paenibacillus wulumuqiensis]|uniref:Ig-like domain-containing protein n=1 Tax=Paenibacillus wulumuqiensis TaxID=1567107 RepID=UPI000695F9CD|nr:hypothetical protein [Paenibacillus wulumuqiensis]